MQSSRSERWMLLAGPAYLLLLILTIVLLGDGPQDGATGKEVIDKIGDTPTGPYAAVFLAGPAAALILVFAARLRGLFGTEAGAGRRLFQYGAVLYASATLLDGVLLLSLIGAADKKLESAAEALNVLNSASWIPTVIGAAVMLIGAGLSVLRTRALPVWLGWVALVVGVISLLGPGGFLGYMVTPLWMAVAGVIAYLRDPADAQVHPVVSA